MPPYVSVIIPCRNEAGFLGACLDSILLNDYPADWLEILVADGRSTDGTREVVAAYTSRDDRVRLIDNPLAITPVALNRAIEAAKGEVIVRLDAHSVIAEDYVRRAVEHLERSGADNVGGMMRTVARDQGWFASSIRAVLEHPFGVGNSHFRTLRHELQPRFVDTVFGGCWHRNVFTRIGMFNENLARGQDMEFNLRLRRSGGRVLLAPDMHSEYFARTTYTAFCKHNWTNGVWALLPFAYSEVVPVRPRHLIPMVFVLALAASLIDYRALLAVAGPYGAVNLAASLHAGWRERSRRIACLSPLVFASLHVTYGAGSVWGAIKLTGILLRRYCSPARQIKGTGEVL